jgi:sulfatase maturation enzyme AslB (radical SAM superfamily)
MTHQTTTTADAAYAPDAGEIADLLTSIVSDGLDHPELWPRLGEFVEHLPELPVEFLTRLAVEGWEPNRIALAVLGILCDAARGDVAGALTAIEPLAVANSQSALVQGAVFYLHSLQDPDNPRYRLDGKVCVAPFVQLDVLERSTHLCCASWLQASAGDLSTTAWQEVWNSPTAQSVRASIHDGSYRYCNKMACPKILANDLIPAAEIAATSDLWAQIVALQATELPVGPEVVNLAYDRTCNLSCPSCRVEKWAADEATRQAYDEMQRTRILPLLKDAKTVFVTGSGDPFASKNFRRLMLELTPEDYPQLGFQIMTNGMLFTPKQWASFPTLHGRVRILKISIDAAEGPTHELLRRGARWPVMLENMRFAGDLTEQGLVDHFELVFTVQQENFREMGDAVDLAKRMGASGIYFARITNWGTFTTEEYARKAVFQPSHPEYQAFLAAMADPRLRDPMVLLGDLHEFVVPAEGHRAFAQ